MKNYIFKVGVSVVLDDQPHRIVHLTADGLAHLIAVSNGALTVTSTPELQRQYQSGRLHFLDEPTNIADPLPSRLGRPLSTSHRLAPSKAPRAFFCDWRKLTHIQLSSGCSVLMC